MNSVTITDSRAPWMQKEDKQIACMTRCGLYRHCSSRIGYECKKLGGDTIPRIRRD